MQYTRINITLPSELAKDLRRSIPARSRSKFIAQTLKERLEQKKKSKKLKKDLIKSLKANYDYYKKVGKEIEEDFKYADAEIIDRLP